MDTFDFFSFKKPFLPGKEGSQGRVSVDLIYDGTSRLVMNFPVDQSQSLARSGRGPTVHEPVRKAGSTGRFPSGEWPKGDRGGASKQLIHGEAFSERGHPLSYTGNNLLLGQIRARIEQAKRYPELAQKSGVQGKALVHFQINEGGHPSNIQLKIPSESELLNQEALATITRAAPFPFYPDPLEVWIKFESQP